MPRASPCVGSGDAPYMVGDLRLHFNDDLPCFSRLQDGVNGWQAILNQISTTLPRTESTVP